MPETTCGKCCTQLFDKSGKTVLCYLCKRIFHKRCSRLDDNAIDAMVSNPSILWKCSTCISLPVDKLLERFASLESLVKEISEKLSLVFNFNSGAGSLPQRCPSGVSEVPLNESPFANAVDRVDADKSNGDHKRPSDSVAAANREIPVDDSAAAQAVDKKREKNRNRPLKSGTSTGKALTDLAIHRDGADVDAGSSTAGATAVNVEDDVNDGTTVVAEKIVNSDLDGANDVNTFQVVKQKKYRSRHLKGVMGSGETSSDLSAVISQRWIHLAKLVNTTSEEQVINYVAKKLNIPTSYISCIKLLKKDASLDTMKFVNFKLGVPYTNAEICMQPEFWPKGIIIRPFRFFKRIA